MAKLLLIYPGHRSEPLSLHSVLLEAHAERQLERAKEIAARIEGNVPLDDATDWAAVSSVDVQRAIASRDSKALAAEAAKLHALVADNALVELPDYVPVDGYDDVFVRFIALSEAERQDHMVAIVAAQDVVDAADKVDPDKAQAQAVRAAYAARDQALLAFIGVAVAELRLDGGQQVAGGERLTASDLEAIRTTGLLLPIYLAARDFQGLARKKDWHFSSAPQST